VRFESLRIANFGSIGELELPLADQGLALILGRNEDAPRADSNGAGKSLPLDAFAWALWGNTIRGFGSDEVVNKKVGKNCVVTVLFSDGGNEYEVTRYRKNKQDKDRKPNDLILKCGGKDVSGASMAATQAAIEEILGLDFTTFCAMMPGAGVNVATMTDAEVKLILESILRTETLSKASDEARKRRREAQQELDVLVARLRDLNAALKEDEARISDLEEKEATYADSRLTKVEDLKANIAELEETKEKWDEIIATEQELMSEKGQAMLALEGAEAEEKKLKADYVKVDTHYQQKVTKLNEEKIAVAARFDSIEKPVEGECPTCKQDISDEHSASLKAAVKAKERVLQIKIDTIEKSTDLTRTAWQNEKKELDTFLGPAAEEVATWQKELAKADRMLDLLQDAKNSSANLQEKISLLSGQLIELESDANPYTALLETEREKLEKRNGEQDKLIGEGMELRNKVDILKFWTDSFAPSGIRSFMLEHVTPLLNQFAKRYSDMITAGEMSITFHTRDTLKSGKSKERFNIQVSQQHGGGSYASNSSGERARANLVIAMALGELASLRAEKTIPFRFLDEPFESIDESGTEAIVTLLNQQQEKYNTVYVITHQDHFKQLFPKKLTMVKQNGISSLEK
jgi:DNA repair exonuclease SbcCD ATPase subunit